MLHWLERFKPLWDFLTAIGTIGLASVTVWLANRKPKTLLRVGAELANEGLILVVRILNYSDATPLLLRCELVGKEFGGIDIPIITGNLNGRPFGAIGVPRMMNGDRLQTWWDVADLVQRVIKALPAGTSKELLETAIRNSLLSCPTTTGESFRGPMPPPVQQALLRSISPTT